MQRSQVVIAGRAALLFAVASLAWGCPAPGYRPSEKDAVERVLVLPLNVVAAMPEELSGGARHVDRILLDYLAERGMAVQTIGFQDAVAAWRAGESDCQPEAKRCDRFLDVAPFVARRLRAGHDYDVMLVPYLLLRGARTDGEVASFDGVKRLVSPGFPADAPLWMSRSRIRAASVKVFGFAPDGKRIFAGIGGLDVVDQIETSGDYGAYTIEVRENVLGDSEAIREGVARALHRLVPRPKPSRS